MADHRGRLEQPLLRAMGTMRLFAPDGSEIVINGKRTRGLLAYLVLAPEQTATRERLCGLLWGDRGDAQARSSLRQCLFELKAALKPLGNEPIEANRDRVTLQRDAIASDVALLDAALVARDVGAVIKRVDLMGTSLLLEDLELSGLFREWQEQQSARVNTAMAQGVMTMLDVLEAEHEWAQVKLLADAWLRRDPLEEAVVASAIRADVASGADAAAHRRFNTFEALLKVELGIAPSATVRAALAGDRPSAPAAIPAPPAKILPLTKAAPMLAVMAFDNLSSDAEMDFFSEGISEEILQVLARTDALKVVARASSFQFRGRDKVTGNVAAALGATHILDGSVRRGGDKVRITAGLIDCSDNSTIWSGRFDGDLSDVFALQDEIAIAVAQGLNLIFAGGNNAKRIDPMAHDCYLRARSLSGSPVHVEQSIALLEDAVALAPDFAPAWASLAMALAVRARWVTHADRFAADRDQSLLAAARATALDPGAGLPLVAMSLLEPDGLFAAREALLDRAMTLAPSDPEMLKQAADFAFSVGRLDESYQIMCRAAEMDPLNPLILSAQAQTKADLGRLEEAYADFAILRKRWPDFDWLTAVPMIIAAHLGDWEAADALLALPRGDSREYRMSRAAVELLKQPEEVRRAHISDSINRWFDERGSIELRNLLYIYANGMRDEAFEAWKRSGHDYRSLNRPEGLFLMSILFGITNGEMRRDVRFLDVCASLGLCNYWVTTNRWPDCVAEVAPFYDLKAEAHDRTVIGHQTVAYRHKAQSAT